MIQSIVKTAAELICPDCGYECNDGEPENDLIKCPNCGEFMYKKADLDSAIFKTANSKKGFVTDIENDTVSNNNFRKVLYTGKYSQLVLMSLGPNEDIGSEVHKDTDQFFRIDEGSGKVVINGIEHKIKNGSAVVVPAGAQHNVVADANGLKLYSIYSPPHHADKTIHATKKDAEVAEEQFDGQTTEE